MILVLLSPAELFKAFNENVILEVRMILCFHGLLGSFMHYIIEIWFLLKLLHVFIDLLSVGVCVEQISLYICLDCLINRN